MNINDLDISILREMAWAKFNDEEYFIFGNRVFYGNEERNKVDYDELKDSDLDTDPMTFYENNCDELLGIEEEHENYLILTDEEADERTKEYIESSVWAFNVDFIIEHSRLPYEAREMVENYQEKCEGANETILALIDDFDEFVEDAISADGRGHFLSSYDGEEHEETITLDDGSSETFYIYRN